jgi:predicted anti-sigma-YlaC factor YlaD
MKTEMMERPGLICHMVRGWAAVSGNVARGHVAHCACCRNFFAAGDGVEQALRRTASQQRIAAPVGMEQRIFAAVRAAEKPARRSAAPSIGFWSLTGVAAAVVAAFIFIPGGLRDRSEKTDTVVDSTDAASTLAALKAAPGSLWAKLEPSAAEAMHTALLQTEADALASDARSAIHFLALNFLPADANSRPRSG